MFNSKKFFVTFLWFILINLVLFFLITHLDMVLLLICLPVFLRFEASLLLSFKSQKEFLLNKIFKPLIKNLNIIFNNLYDFLEYNFSNIINILKPLLNQIFSYLKVTLKVTLNNVFDLIKKYLLNKYNIFKEDIKNDLKELKKENISFNNIFGIFLYYPHYESKKSIFVRFSAVFVLIFLFLLIFYVCFVMDNYYSEEDYSISCIITHILAVFLLIFIYLHIYYSILHLYKENSINTDIIIPAKNFYIYLKDKIKIFYIYIKNLKKK